MFFWTMWLMTLNWIPMSQWMTFSGDLSDTFLVCFSKLHHIEGFEGFLTPGHIFDARKDSDQSNQTIVNLYWESCDLIGHYIFWHHSYDAEWFRRIIFDIFFPTKVNRENEGDLYSACSNPTIVESHALLARGLIGWFHAPINFSAPNIKLHCLLL